MSLNIISNDEFDRLWDGARSRIFRLEQFSSYNVPADFPTFLRHKSGGEIRSSELMPEWYERIATKVRSGVRVDRLRVFDLPLPDYQKYEIDWGYAVGEFYGQATWAMRRELFADLCKELRLPPTDFWVFDEQPVLIEYTDEVDYVGPYYPETEELIRVWIQLAETLLGRSFSLRDFCQANNIEMSTSRICWDSAPPEVPPIP